MIQNVDIEIQLLKQRQESSELRLQFLEKNWLKWTKESNAIGQQVVAALLEKTR